MGKKKGKSKPTAAPAPAPPGRPPSPTPMPPMPPMANPHEKVPMDTAATWLQYRTTMCTYGPNCQYGSICNSAHTQDELRTEVMNRKDGLTSMDAVNAFRDTMFGQSLKFRTRRCVNPNCPRKQMCDFYHNDEERRTAAQNERDGLNTPEAVLAYKKRGVLPNPATKSSSVSPAVVKVMSTVPSSSMVSASSKPAAAVVKEGRADNQNNNSNNSKVTSSNLSNNHQNQSAGVDTPSRQSSMVSALSAPVTPKSETAIPPPPEVKSRAREVKDYLPRQPPPLSLADRMDHLYTLLDITPCPAGECVPSGWLDTFEDGTTAASGDDDEQRARRILTEAILVSLEEMEIDCHATFDVAFPYPTDRLLSQAMLGRVLLSIARRYVEIGRGVRVSSHLTIASEWIRGAREYVDTVLDFRRREDSVADVTTRLVRIGDFQWGQGSSEEASVLYRSALQNVAEHEVSELDERRNERDKDDITFRLGSALYMCGFPQLSKAREVLFSVDADGHNAERVAGLLSKLDQIQCYNDRGVRAMSDGDNREALRCFELGAEVDTSNSAVQKVLLYKQAAAHMNARHYAAAEDALNRAINHDRSVREFYDRRSRCRLALGDVVGADEDCGIVKTIMSVAAAKAHPIKS
eukprot:PhM_4_TR3833/c2_g1_i2/m.51102